GVRLPREALSSKKGLWVTAGILSGLLTVSLVYLLSRDEARSQETSLNAARATTRRAPLPTSLTARPQPAASPSAASSPEQMGAQAASEQKEVETPEQRSADRATRARAESQKPAYRRAGPEKSRALGPAAGAQREMPDPEPAAEGPPRPEPRAPARTVASEPAPGNDRFESNPYLRK
ncbi:MAG TPA: hypothetical protein VK524_10850, partial [Polyangiaceae bacterium]|nr:hypothetical protein [Polyangiaceae bacterium]